MLDFADRVWQEVLVSMNEEKDQQMELDRRRNTNRMEASEDSSVGSESESPAAQGRNIQIVGEVKSSVLVTGNDNQITINAAPTQGPLGDATLNLLSSQLETLSADLSEEKAIRLEELREQFREGAMQQAYDEVQALYRSANWATFSATLRASILRVLATMTLSLKGENGIAEAREFAARAKSVKPTTDDRTLEMRITVLAEGHETALERLGDPVNLDTYNLRLGLLLETGRTEDAIDAFDHPPSGIIFDTETRRLLALARLAQKDVAGAREQITKALAEHPGRLYLRYQAAIIDYFGALSEFTLPSHLVPFPKPVSLSMVRGDTESLQRLAQAAEEFKRISDLGGRSLEERRNVQTWQLASVANLPDRQQEAIKLCKELLSDDPGNAHILSWVLFRRFDMDLSASRLALEESLNNHDDDGDTARLEVVLILVGIYLNDGDQQEALDLLGRYKEAFVAVGENDLWRYWRGQALVATGEAQTALGEAKDIDDLQLRRALRTAALLEIANRDRDWQPLLSHLEQSYAEGDQNAFLILCELKAQLGEWAFVANRAELYCDVLGTATAARLVIAASWNAGRPTQCLRLLNQYEPLFEQGKLPFELRRLRIHCLIDSDIKTALSEAEALALEDASATSLMLLMDVRLSKGDLVGLELNARELLNRAGVTAEQFLRAAHLVQLNNPSLAKRLWLRAVENASNSAAARLGLEKQRGSLMQRMMEYAEHGEGPIKAMNMEQTLQMMKEATQQNAQLQQMYAAAEAPIHLVAKGGMVQVFHGLAGWNRAADSRNRRHLMVRHGGRTLLPINYAEVATNWRLHCDISSLLLAHELGVLEKIERQFRPLRISRHTVTALIAQRDKLKPHQKSQVDQSHTLLEAMAKKKLRVRDADLPNKWLEDLRKLLADACAHDADGHSVVAEPQAQREKIPADPNKLEQQLGLNRLEVFAAAVAEDSFAVTFLPAQCYGESRTLLLSLPDSLMRRLVNGRAIADALRGGNRITEAQYQRALDALGTEGHCYAAVTPLIGTQLFLSEGMADVLIGAELFDRVCSNFEVVISSSCVKEAEGMIEHYDRLSKIENWLNELLTRISEGVDDGTYEFISIPDERIAQRDDQEERVNQDFKSTLDLFLFEPQEWDVIWLDDRSLNKYPLRGDDKKAVPLVGIQEVLLTLRAQGELDEHDYFELLLKMRESDFRYLPFDVDEILHHLSRARIERGVVIETDALRSIRRYYSSCILDKEFLQFATSADGSPNSHSELPFVIQTINGTADAIGRVWQDANCDPETATARADWILNSLYTGNFGCASLRGDSTPPSQLFTPPKLIGLDVCNLVMRGIGMMGNPMLGGEVSQRRNDYFDWLASRVIDRTYVSDPEVIKAAAAELKERFGLIRGQPRQSDGQELFARAFAGKFFLDLPEVIAEQINFDEEQTEWLQLRIGSVASIGGENFHADDYWRAVEQALRDGAASVTSQSTAKEYRFVRVSGGNLERGSENEFPKISVVDTEGNQAGEMNDPSLGLLLPDEVARRTTVLRLRGWFDCGREEFEAEANELVETEDPAKGMGRLYEWRTRSTELFYHELEARLRRQEDITFPELMPPSLASLAHRLQLPLKVSEGKFEGVWEKSAEAFLEIDELLAVLARFASLPVRLPQVILDAFSAQSQEQRRELLERVFCSWKSPIRLLHVVNLALRLPGDSGIEIARKVLGDLYGEKGEKEFASFRATLVFVNEEVAEIRESKSWSPEIRLALAWMHACRLHDLMRAVGFPCEALCSLFEKRGGTLRSALMRDGCTWYDCAHPVRLNRTSLLTHGFARLLQGVDGSSLETAGIPSLTERSHAGSQRPLFYPWRRPP